jgi:pilus assembly protein CpaB
MRAKSLILFVIAVGCGLAASIGVSQYMESASSAAPQIETAKILVTMTDLGIGDKLDAQTVKLEEWPKDRIPDGAVLELAEIEGKSPRMRMYAGEPILVAKLTGNNQSSAVDTIPKGYRAVPVKVSAETAGGLIQPGDRVDVLVMLRKSAEIPETGTRTILRDVNVFSVDGATERSIDETGQARNVNTVLLLVKPGQAASVTLASELGRLFLTLRRPDDDTEDASEGVSVRSLLGNGGENANENRQRSNGGFDDWLSTQQSTPEPTTSEPIPAPAVEPKWRMIVMGSSGSTEYHWTDEDELPTEGAFGATPPGPTPPGLVAQPAPTVPISAPQPPAGLGPPISEDGELEDGESDEDDDEQAVAPH